MEAAAARGEVRRRAAEGAVRWYWQILGGHTHVRVFMNGAKCGDLCFRNEEFAELVSVEGKVPRWVWDNRVELIEDDPARRAG